MKKIKCCNIVFILALLFCLFLPCVTSAQVTLTDEEARSLGHELAIAKTSIANCRQELENSNKKLMTANERLKALSEDLETQKQSLIVQSVQLNAANLSLKQLNEEHKNQIKRLSRQRNFAYFIAAVFVAVAVRN